MGRGTPVISPPGGAGFKLARGGGSVIVNADGTVSIVGDTDITGTLAVTGAAAFAGNVVLTSAEPVLAFVESAAPANNRRWDWDVVNEEFTGRVLNDAVSSATAWITVNRTDNTVDSIVLAATAITISGTLAVTGAITPSGDINFSGQASPKIIMGTAGLLFRDDTDATTHGSFDGSGKFSLTDALDVIGIVSIAGGGANGAKENIKVATTELTGLTGASVTAASLIPAGSFIVGVTIRVTTTITGATTFDIGDGTDVDRWGAAILLPAGTTTDITDFTAAGFGQFAVANDVVLTANGANFTAGAVRITVHYADLTPATA